MTPATGYLSSDYARSLGGFGEILQLPRSGGALIVRPVPGDGRRRDAIGPYPMLACRDWGELEGDLADVGEGLVSVVAVCDPFGTRDPALLARTFRDLLRPFKRHFVVELGRDPLQAASSHHRRAMRKAARRVDVERCRSALDHLDDWCDLYDAMAARKDMRGMSSPGRDAFAVQLALPGCIAFRACVGTSLVGMQVWMVHERVACGHFMALTKEGYRTGAGYALHAASLVALASEADWANLGGVPGKDDEDSTLARFKAGWSSGTRTAWLGGRILDLAAYTSLRTGCDGDWFPAYRAPRETPTT